MTVFCAWFALAVGVRAQPVVIDGSQTNQLIEGFGVNLNYQGWTNNDLKPVIDALVGQANMTLFRVVFDNTDWEGTNDNDDPDVMNWDYYNTIYSSATFQQLWGVIGYLNQKGITNGIILNFQGAGPDWMGGGSLTPGYEDEWAEMIASLLIYARNTQHLQFHLVAPDNEPDDPPQGISVQNSDQYVTMLHYLAVKLDTNDMSDIQFVLPDLAFTDTNFMAAIMNDPVVMAKVAHFGLHSYTAGGVDSYGVYDFIQQSPYPYVTFWMTEFNVWCPQCEAGESGDDDWSYCEGTASYLLSHLANGASAGIVWEGYDSIYYIMGEQWSFWGLLGVDDTNAVDKTYTPRKDFYTLSQISSFVPPGAYSIGLNNNADPFAQLLAFWQPATGQLTITGINTSGDAEQLSCTLASLPGIANLELYYTDDTSNLVDLATVPVTNGTDFTANIPADCVFTLTGTPFITALITNPVNGTQFSAPVNIPIQASVSTTAGVISGVEFFNGQTNLGTFTNPPYSIVWSNAAPGNYALTVVASNSVGYSVTSPVVNISVVGPLAQISVMPSNITVNPLGAVQFSAVASDALGTALNPQPSFVWSAAGGVIDSNGLFTAGSGAGGPFTVTASNNSVIGSAGVIVLSNIAPLGTAYTWYTMSSSSHNSPSALAPGINDGDLDTDVPLRPDEQEEPSIAWEAAGVLWSNAQTINGVTYINGSMNEYDDGVFAASFGLQFSSDGVTWTNAGPEWTVTPAYVYNSAASADTSFAWTGGQVTTMGVRCIGEVHTSHSPQNSWIAFATELEAYAAPSQPVLLAGLTGDGVVISWSGSVTNFLLETTTNFVPPYDWSTVTNAIQPVGDQQQVIIPATAAQQFFRLRQQ